MNWGEEWRGVVHWHVQWTMLRCSSPFFFVLVQVWGELVGAVHYFERACEPCVLRLYLAACLWLVFYERQTIAQVSVCLCCIFSEWSSCKRVPKHSSWQYFLGVKLVQTSAKELFLVVFCLPFAVQLVSNWRRFPSENEMNSLPVENSGFRVDFCFVWKQLSKVLPNNNCNSSPLYLRFYTFEFYHLSFLTLSSSCSAFFMACRHSTRFGRKTIGVVNTSAQRFVFFCIWKFGVSDLF